MGIQHQLLRNASLASSKTLNALTPQIPPARIPGHVQSSRCSTALSRSFYRTPLNSTTNLPKISTLSKPKPRLVLSHPSRRVGIAMASSGSVQNSEEEWKAILTPEQFRILRMKGTEYPGTGQYDKFFGEGIYECAGCGTPLYKSTTKFNSGCGWPAFYEGLPGAINRSILMEGERK
ncbi:peptide methionine sulfoxide reductase B5-like isoform X2 [Phoenix dactylifera]|uniref:Peptide methionine sulfoxide reductase B5-like isoform X2 n=1 Tax=Phoenix dactylifera TaxID=42345 RepID=A0A8B9APL7_PHODC|nr:peptide methionine sulfoxide reductase B5-like isoform X2 [Phoenix dactylifera]